MINLVGNTGFVGSNLWMSNKFDKGYNSKNITEAYNTNPEILIYAGLRAEKYLANNFPEKDYNNILVAQENIQRIDPQKIIFISTIDVYETPIDVTESTKINIDNLLPYGKNRLILERWIQENFNDYLIVRLPGLYGENMKKNFIYDMINFVPSMLNEKKLLYLSNQDEFIKKYYDKLDNGFYKCREVHGREKKVLINHFEKLGFSALDFTDSRGVFQYYNLKFLWEHIQIALKNKIKILNIATEPIRINDIYRMIMGKNFKNFILDDIPYYNFKTEYSEIFGGSNGYIFDKDFILNDISKFVNQKRKSL